MAFDYADDTVFGLVGRAVSEMQTVVLAVLPLDYVEIIHSPLVEVVGATETNWMAVFPCADIAQLRRVALKYGDARARRKLFGL